MCRLAFIFAWLLMAMPALADDLPRVVSSKADATALTIYPDDLALITETRKVDLPKGKSTIVFEDVSDRMIPASVLLREFRGLTIERNFDYALLNKANLFENSIGEMVTLTRTDNKSGIVRQVRAKIHSAGAKNQGVVFDINGKFEVFGCSGLSEGTWFDGLPEGLNNVPELSIDVEVTQAGPQEVVISYLADKFSWEANYRLDLEGDAGAKLSGWLTINNQTSQSFKDAPLAIIAGKLNRKKQPKSIPRLREMYGNCWPMQTTQTPIAIRERLYSEQDIRFGLYAGYDGSLSLAPPPPMVQNSMAFDETIVTAQKRREVEQEDLGDYKLYRVNEPVTVAAYQTKQIKFIKAPEVEVEKLYTLDAYVSLIHQIMAGIYKEEYGLAETSIEYRLNNDKDGKIAKPLPKGTMRLFARNKAGHKLVIGETNVRDTPIGNPMKIYLDKSFLVQVGTSHVRRELEKISGGGIKIQNDITHVITNASGELARVEINIPGSYASLKIGRVSHKPDPDVGPNGWTISVPPGQSTTLKYRATFVE